MSSVLQLQQGRTLVVTINRPERRNAVDRETAADLAAAFKDFENDRELDVAILAGTGTTFCAGADLKALADGRGNRIVADGDGPMGPTRLEMSKPVIAAVEGHCVAGGLELAIWCDLRVASETAIFGVYCRRFGVPLVDGGTVRLPRLIGHSRAMDMILTGRAVHAEEAHRFGLANRVVPAGAALPEALELADQISGFPQLCMRGDRRSVLEQWGLNESSAMENEMTHGLATVNSGETLRGATRFSEGQGRHGGF
ncbi:MAG: crotonase/enoyl-CoA hydratase family protein [Acidimicrobiales bacterium]|nr:crotonase/enoyl-CoA hydratase family protein [Acidimicrobiales bacterium]